MHNGALVTVNLEISEVALGLTRKRGRQARQFMRDAGNDLQANKKATGTWCVRSPLFPGPVPAPIANRSQVQDRSAGECL